MYEVRGTEFIKEFCKNIKDRIAAGGADNFISHSSDPRNETNTPRKQTISSGTTYSITEVKVFLEISIVKVG